jgi:SsrA-binding protein
MRVRKLLLHKKEINHLIGTVERKGYSVLATSMYWKNNRVKVNIAIGKGKKLHDKRQVLKEKASQRDIQRASKQSFKDA